MELVKPRRSLIGTVILVAAAATWFVIMRRADANFLGLPPGYLAGPTATVLAVVIAAAHVVAAVFLVSHAPRGRFIAALAAAAVLVAGIALVMAMRGVAWVPAVLFFVGFIELLLVAGSTPRKAPHRKHVPGHR